MRSGAVDCALTLGFDQMESGALKEYWPDRISPMKDFRERIDEIDGKEFDKRTQVIRMFAAAGKEHSKKYGTKFDTFAKIAEKNHKHASKNKNALFQKVFTLDEIKKSRMIHWPETLLSCSPNANGAAAAVLCSEEFVKKHGLEDQAVEIKHMSLQTDTPQTFNGSAADLVGKSMAQRAAKECY